MFLQQEKINNTDRACLLHGIVQGKGMSLSETGLVRLGLTIVDMRVFPGIEGASGNGSLWLGRSVSNLSGVVDWRRAPLRRIDDILTPIQGKLESVHISNLTSRAAAEVSKRQAETM